MTDYPELPPRLLANLWVVKAGLEADPGYLQAAECPYSDDLRQLLAGLAGNSSVPGVTSGAETPERTDRWGELGEETAELRRELRDFARNLSAEDVSEHMAYFRTATALTEKLITIGERIYGIRQSQEFMRAVLQVFDEELSPELRTRVMDRLRSFNGE